jgi:demethylmenaquinone methyltransferase/2-methoxy-6-polyprenyl-1,4-benzoquinol methylase
MQFDDGEFDVVTISLGLHDMPLEVRTLVLKEVKRVLKKDGKLFILEYDLPKSLLLGSLSSHLINIFESKYYLDFIRSDLDNYLNTFGFKTAKKTNYLFNHLRLITLYK